MKNREAENTNCVMQTFYAKNIAAGSLAQNRALLAISSFESFCFKSENEVNSEHNLWPIPN